MDYSKLSDKQINAAVAMKLISIDGGYLCSTFDPCNNPADAWPIILQSRLYIDPIYIKEWCVTSECDSYREIHENPLRAAMLVYLMMQGDEQ